MLKWIGIGIGILIVAAFTAIILLQAPTNWRTGEIVRTPDSRFENLPDYSFTANFVEVHGYRIHYVDEGPRNGETVILMHGQPSWSYLYRHMIPLLTAEGYRVIAPDLVGFGKSDKPTQQSSHSYQMHVDVMSEFLRVIDLQGATMFAQDWGGLIGLRMVAEEPDRFERIMISNTGLPAAGGLAGWIGYPMIRFQIWRQGKPQTMLNEAGEFDFLRWMAYAKHVEDFDLAALFQWATTRNLSAEELAGYSAPYPDRSFEAAIRKFPSMVPSQLRQNQKAMDEFYTTWDKPFLTTFGDSDPVTAGGEQIWQQTVPGAKDQAHVIIEDGHHFIQEDKPEELVELLVAFIQANEST